MAKPLVPDELWTLVEPLLPPVPEKPFGGRPPVSNRAALGGILFVLKTGIPWAMLPSEMGCGSALCGWKCFGGASGYNRRMAHEQQEGPLSTASDIGAFSKSKTEGGVFVLVVYRDGNLTAAVHTTERGAREAAADFLIDESGTLEDRFARAQRLVFDEGGIMEIVSSPVFGG